MRPEIAPYAPDHFLNPLGLLSHGLLNGFRPGVAWIHKNHTFISVRQACLLTRRVKGWTALMNRYIEHLDQNGVAGYLEKDRSENVDFYRKFGFSVQREEPLIGTPTWYMWRPARPEHAVQPAGGADPWGSGLGGYRLGVYYPFDIDTQTTVTKDGVASNEWKIHEHIGTQIDALSHVIVDVNWINWQFARRLSPDVYNEVLARGQGANRIPSADDDAFGRHVRMNWKSSSHRAPYDLARREPAAPERTYGYRAQSHGRTRARQSRVGEVFRENLRACVR